MTVLAYAARQRPDAAATPAAVVLGATATMRGVPEVANLALSSNLLYSPALRAGPLGRRLVRAVAFGDSSPPHAVADTRRRWADCPAPTRWAYGLGLMGEDITAEVARITVPVLAVTGTKDRIAPPARARAIAAAAPRGRFELVAGVGHAIVAEAPGTVGALILATATA
jgi:pimeloyl-ACP methyl ester carboxylesterase